jgi:hypothetical protein
VQFLNERILYNIELTGGVEIQAQALALALSTRQTHFCPVLTSI